jgi:hypothetical protein
MSVLLKFHVYTVYTKILLNVRPVGKIRAKTLPQRPLIRIGGLLGTLKY